MSDPLSIVSAVIAMATLTIQSSRVLSELMVGIKGAPSEINTIARDISAFRYIVVSLKSMLEDKNTADAVRCDETLAKLIGNVSISLYSCEEALESVTSKIQSLSKYDRGNAVRTTARNLKWAFSAKKDAKELHLKIGDAKLTLITAIELVALRCGLRAMATVRPSLSGNTTSDINIYSTSDNAKLQTQESPTLIKFDKSFLDEKNMLPQDHDQSNAHSQPLLEMQQAGILHHSNSVGTNASGCISRQVSEAYDEEFFDCQSNFYGSDTANSTDTLQKSCSITPTPYFESGSSFYPEQYSLEGPSSHQFSVHASIQVQGDRRVQKLFITYAQSPRRLKRIIISAIFEAEEYKPLGFQYSVYDYREASHKAIPNLLLNIVRHLLLELYLYSSITSISLPLIRDQSGELRAKEQELTSAEDISEILLGREDEILQDIESMGCPTFLESEVATLSRVSNSRFIVSIGSRICLERRVPFASSGSPDTNSFLEYWDDLKQLNTLRNCKHVIQFFGIILDDSRKFLRGYLHEFPNYQISKALEAAESQFHTISWNIREKWAMQIVSAVAEVHRHGLVADIGELWRLYIRANGCAVLGIAMLPRRFLKDRHGLQAPELRERGSQSTSRKPSFRTDIFSLGLILWQLAEHRGHMSAYLCPRNGCIKKPKHSCKAEHANPIGLPNCSPSIPIYFREMINKCRYKNPKDRPSAHQLLASFPEEVKSDKMPIGIEEIRRRFPPIHSGATAHCAECGVLTSWSFYECEICDIEFCPKCMLKDIHCKDSKHQLTWGWLPAPAQSIMS